MDDNLQPRKMLLIGGQSMRISLSIILVACLALCGPAWAQQEDDVALGRREALVRQYFDAIGFAKLMDATAAVVMNAQLESATGASALTPEARQIIVEMSRETLREASDLIADRYVVAYAEAFTEEELQALVAFYDSRIGRSITTKSVLLAQESGPIMAEIMPVIEADMRARMCERIKCAEARK